MRHQWGSCCRTSLAVLTLLSLGSGQAQYTNTLTGRQFSNMWAANADFMWTQAIQSASMRSMLNRASGQKAAGTASVAAPPAYKYTLDKTDFRFQGQPTQQQNCAALAEKPADRQQLADTCLRIFRTIQELPDFRKNNLAAGLTVLIGISLQVALEKEVGDAESKALQRDMNELLVGAGLMKKLKAADIQRLYETSLMTGGLIAAIAQRGTDEQDESLKQLAKALATTVLGSFGLKNLN